MCLRWGHTGKQQDVIRKFPEGRSGTDLSRWPHLKAGSPTPSQSRGLAVICLHVPWLSLSSVCLRLSVLGLLGALCGIRHFWVLGLLGGPLLRAGWAGGLPAPGNRHRKLQPGSSCEQELCWLPAQSLSEARQKTWHPGLPLGTHSAPLVPRPHVRWGWRSWWPH